MSNNSDDLLLDKIINKQNEKNSQFFYDQFKPLDTILIKPLTIISCATKGK